MEASVHQDVELDPPVKLASFTSFGREYDLYAANGSNGSFCTAFFEGREYRGGGCSFPLSRPEGQIPIEETTNSNLGSGDSQNAEFLDDGPWAIAGRVPAGASELFVRFEDETKEKLPIRRGLFAYVVGGVHQSIGSRPVELIAVDENGHALDHLSPGQYSAN